MAGPCYKSGKETGPWFEMLCIRKVIDGKEKRGIDASFEKSLLKSWLKFPDYKRSDEDNRRRGLYKGLSLVANQNPSPSRQKHGESYKSREKPEVLQHNKSGRPRKSDDEPMHRTTKWRHEKEKQLVMEI